MMQIVQFQCRNRIDGQERNDAAALHLPGTFTAGFSILEKSDARVR